MNKRIKKKQARANVIKVNKIKLQELTQLRAEDLKLDQEINQLRRQIESKRTTFKTLQSIQSKLSEQIKNLNWKKIDISKEVGKKKYTEGQKNYLRALKVIENALDKPASDITSVYGSDDIEELANQYFIGDLSEYSKEELEEIEKEFNKTHGYQIRLERAVNPFADIDFNTLMPN